MKASKFIKELQEIISEYGDLEVWNYDDSIKEWYKPSPFPELKENFFGDTSMLEERIIYLS